MSKKSIAGGPPVFSTNMSVSLWLFIKFLTELKSEVSRSPFEVAVTLIPISWKELAIALPMPRDPAITIASLFIFVPQYY